MKNFLSKFLPLFLLLFVAAPLLSACGEPEQQGEALPSLFSGEQLHLEDAEGEPYSSVSVTVAKELYGQVAASQPGYAAGDRPEEVPLCRNISQALEQIAGDYIAACQAEDDAQRLADPDYKASHQMELFLFYAGADVISIKAELYENVSGAAHSVLRFRGYNFDQGGNALPLSALLGSDFQEKVFPAILGRLEENKELGNYYPDLEQLLQVGFAEEKWCADGDQVYLFYDPYEIAAHAMGAQEFAVPR